MKSQRKNYSRKNNKNKKTKKNAKRNTKRNSKSRNMKGGTEADVKIHQSYKNNNKKTLNSKASLATIISKFTKDTTFEIIDNKDILQNPENIEIIGDTIVDNKNITNIVINNCSIDNKIANELFLIIRNNRNISSIDLQNNKLGTNSELKSLSELETVSDLELLNFIKTMITENTEIKSLNLAGNNPIMNNPEVSSVMKEIENMLQERTQSSSNENL
jgi:hypothetical protein